MAWDDGMARGGLKWHAMDWGVLLHHSALWPPSAPPPSSPPRRYHASALMYPDLYAHSSTALPNPSVRLGLTSHQVVRGNRHGDGSCGCMYVACLPFLASNCCCHNKQAQPTASQQQVKRSAAVRCLLPLALASLPVGPCAFVCLCVCFFGRTPPHSEASAKHHAASPNRTTCLFTHTPTRSVVSMRGKERKQMVSMTAEEFLPSMPVCGSSAAMSILGRHAHHIALDAHRLALPHIWKIRISCTHIIRNIR